ncbi:MAG TPA: ATP-dependent DNA helicase RecQ [Ohtaekwangia sp.]|nr:ATP-dependent DNA helicase RecQ [Ohtaekwangia sp.]
MSTPISILQQYWKHNEFRPLQAEIVESVLKGTDTLALLPTGGGKSVCFQVPALLLNGVCIVVTPLIALMNDQVEQLKKKGIIAVAIHSGMSRREIDILLDNCIYGQVKFLYVSPERLHTEIFIERVKKMTVNLIAVDEAHCISQWGYDFRPPYLKIAALRELKPEATVIALTASATVQVQHDIMDKLAFRTDHQLFQKSFARDNLSFVVRKTENKEKKLLDILNRVKGPAILYVRSRKATQEIAGWLSRRNISASFYHAGLDFDDRSKRQDEWIKNKSRVMVATNAFGMGIDKPDVRVVVHLDLPENLESYYQEAGRAGRDGKRAYAVVLYHEADLINLKRKTEQAHPEPEVLKSTYQSLANYYQLAEGSGEGQSYDFDINAFADRFQRHVADVYNALKKLEEEGFIHFNESYYSPSHLHLLLNKAELYQFQVANAKFDPVIKMLLRLYGGELATGLVKISEAYIARALSVSFEEVVNILQYLNSLNVFLYEPAKDKPQITFVQARKDAERLPLNLKRLAERKALVMSKMAAMQNYVSSSDRCRMLMLQHYFDEKTLATCGICDVCLERKKKENQHAFKDMRSEVLTVVRQDAFTLEQVEEIISPKDNTLFIDVVRDLVDEGVVEYDSAWRLKIVPPGKSNLI